MDYKVPLAANPILLVASWCKPSHTLYCSLKTKAVFCVSLELAPDPCGLCHVRRRSAVYSIGSDLRSGGCAETP